MKKSLFAVMVACLLMAGLGMACEGVDVEDNTITGGLDIYGQPEPVRINDFCGVSLEFGSTYIESYKDWVWNKVYISNANVNGASVEIMDGERVALDTWVGFNANSCTDIKGEDGFHHTGCPWDTWLEVNAHIKLSVTYNDTNGNPVDCPRNGTVFDLDP